MLRKRNMIKWLFTAIIIGSICIGGTLAYLTDYDVAANEFTVGKVDIELTEPNWKPEDYKNLVPTQEIKKDPSSRSDPEADRSGSERNEKRLGRN